jgi:hypothetical protein
MARQGTQRRGACQHEPGTGFLPRLSTLQLVLTFRSQPGTRGKQWVGGALAARRETGPMPRIRTSSALSLSLLFLMPAWSSPGWAYKCDPGGPGKGQCYCQGTSDCQEMKNSGMCGGYLNCSQGKCTCTAARNNPPTGGDPTDPGVRRPDDVAPLPPTERQPP